ncbi:hypothetical protein RCO27_01115 [Sphingosinicella sp. LHD-64]|uniref:hypothetical protein n=1 Tax=Sphingosinicella sp. LHD-64 TaxID=3072139 RepID=UPI00280E7C9D|nr:hypothetical protein [Sphingosinicella sp. LHD-64]MDQ8754815.1 hypothetical protein [Sphingosinicella sp. LHD-64]
MKAARGIVVMTLGMAAALPAAAQTTTSGTPGPIEIAPPAVSGRSAYVNQIGNANQATVTQTAPNASISIRQDGERNLTTVTQGGDATSYGNVVQTGNENEANLSQRGSGINALYLTQTGIGNRALAQQTGQSGALNGAVLTQAGTFNEMNLLQEGSDNRAALAQDGNGNQMTAAQTGVGNRLIWTQQGNNLSNLGITQTGAQAIQVTQTGGN